MSVKVLYFSRNNYYDLLSLSFNIAARNGTTSCVVRDILIFCSGADRLPPLGFERELKIVFVGQEAGKLSTASTCDLTLRLPTVHGDDYESFKEALTMSLKGNDGFGGV